MSGSDENSSVSDPVGNPTMVKVYDLEGNEHVVNNLNAHDLVTHLKWTRSPPIVKIVEVESTKEVASKNVSEVDETKSNALPKVEDMSMEDLVSEAKTYGIKKPETFPIEALRSAVLAERAKGKGA